VEFYRNSRTACRIAQHKESQPLIMSTSGDTAHTDTDCGKLLPSEEQTQAALTDVSGLKYATVAHVTCAILAVGGDGMEEWFGSLAGVRIKQCGLAFGNISRHSAVKLLKREEPTPLRLKMCVNITEPIRDIRRRSKRRRRPSAFEETPTITREERLVGLWI